MRRAHFKAVALKPDEERKWDETLAACNWIGPGFVHIMYSMLVPKGRTMAALFTNELPYLGATDGFQLIYNPTLFFQLPLMKRVFVMFHEIMHNIWDHCGMGYRCRMRGYVTWDDIDVPYHDELANLIQDLIINDTLYEARMGEFDPGWLREPDIATYKDSWVEVYVKLYKECQGRGRGKGKGKGRGKTAPPPGQSIEEAIEQLLPPKQDTTPPAAEGDKPPAPPRQGQFDLHLDPGTGSEEKEAPRERSEMEWQQAVAAGMAVAKAQGKLPAALELVFGEILAPTVSWKDHIRALFARRVGSGGYDWRKPDRRLIIRDIIAPGRSGHGARLIVVGADNSGSIYSDKTVLGRFLGEVGGILEELNPEEIVLIFCDAEVHEVDNITDASDIVGIQRRGSTGGGGTSFVPVFQWIEDNHLRPDVLVYLTDMMGDFPDEEPAYPVIWGSISDPDRYPAPFGDLVFIPTTNDQAQ